MYSFIMLHRDLELETDQDSFVPMKLNSYLSSKFFCHIIKNVFIPY